MWRRRRSRASRPSSRPRLELVRLAKEQGLSLTGPDGLLKQLTKTVLETALNEEMTEHLGYEKHDPAGAGTGNIRNGTRAKTVLTEHSGPVEIDVPRDRARDVRAADREEAAASPQRRRRGRALPLGPFEDQDFVSAHPERSDVPDASCVRPGADAFGPSAAAVEA